MDFNKLIKLKDEDYFAAEGVNFSSLKNLYISPKHYKHALENPEPSSPAQVFGRAVHAATLDAEEFAKSFYLYAGKVDRRTKEGKEVVAAAGTREIVGLEVSEIATTILLTVPELKRCVRENAVFWNEGNYTRKAKIDAYDEASGIIYDIKTTTDISTFEKSIYNYKYYAQAAYYKDAIEAAGLPFNGFKFIAVEKDEPFDCAVFELSDRYMKLGEAEIKTLLERLEMCKQFDSWEGFSNGETITVEPPSYANLALIGE